MHRMVTVRRLLVAGFGGRFGLFLIAQSDSARASHVRRLADAAGHPAFVRR
jgi:hypothetical protein